MKKIILALAATLTLAACGNNDLIEERNAKTAEVIDEMVNLPCLPADISNDLTCGDQVVLFSNKALDDSSTPSTLKTIIFIGVLEQLENKHMKLDKTLPVVNSVCSALTPRVLDILEDHDIRPYKACTYFEEMSYQKI